MGLRSAAVVSAAALCASFGAQAQQAGTYTGTTQDGSPVTIGVSIDPNNSKFEITLLSFEVTATCKKSMESLFGIAIGFEDGHDITGDKFSYASGEFFETDLVTTMTFHGTHSVKRKIALNLAAFNPANGHDSLTDKIQLCSFANQPFTAAFSNDAMPVTPAAAATMKDRDTTIGVGLLPAK